MAVTGQVRAMTSTDDGYIRKFDNTGGQPIYEGIAEAGTDDDTAEWKIYKYTYDGDGAVTSILLAGGKRNFATSWTGRAAAAYS